MPKLNTMTVRCIATLGLVNFTFACYFDKNNFDSRNKNPRPTIENADPTKTRGQCRMSSQLGCFDGQIAVAPQIFVDGKSFFDADQLGHQAVDAFKLRNPADKNLEVDTEIFTAAKIDNRNFARGFQVFLKGENPFSFTSSGAFVINDLAPGFYNDLRVQKTFTFEVHRVKNSTEKKSKEILSREFRCLSLYADLSFEIRGGERTRKVFDEFSTEEITGNCGLK